MVSASAKVRPTYVGSSSIVIPSGSTTSLVLNVPAGVQNGDLLIAFVCGAVGGVTDWIQTNFTWAVEENGSKPNLGIAYRTANSEPSSYTFTTSSSRPLGGVMIAYRGAAFDQAGTLSSTETANAITVSEDNSILIGYWAVEQTNQTFGTPSGMTSRGVSYTAGNAPNWAVFVQDVSAGSTGTKTSTSGGSTESSALISIKPA